MAATDATFFPVKAQAYRIPVCIRDTSGNLITGWTGAASSIIVDGAAAVAGSAPVESGATGVGWLDLTTAQTNGQLIEVKCTVSNTNATALVRALYPLDLSELSAPGYRHAQTHSVRRLEQFLVQLLAAHTNPYSVNGNQLTLLKSDGSQYLSGTYTDAEGLSNRGALR